MSMKRIYRVEVLHQELGWCIVSGSHTYSLYEAGHTRLFWKSHNYYKDVRIKMITSGSCDWLL